MNVNVQNNVGSIDRILRIVVGLGLVTWMVMGGPLWALIGVVPLVTGVLGWCPAYLPFGFSTCAAKK